MASVLNNSISTMKGSFCCPRGHGVAGWQARIRSLEVLRLPQAIYRPQVWSICIFQPVIAGLVDICYKLHNYA